MVSAPIVLIDLPHTIRVMKENILTRERFFQYVATRYPLR